MMSGKTKSKTWTTPNNHHAINTYVGAVKEDIEPRKTFTLIKIRPNLKVH